MPHVFMNFGFYGSCIKDPVFKGSVFMCPDFMDPVFMDLVIAILLKPPIDELLFM